MENYYTLVNISKETIGSSFQIAYSVKAGKTNVYLTNLHKRFSDESPRIAVQKAIEFIINNRKPHPSHPGFYTLFNYKITVNKPLLKARQQS